MKKIKGSENVPLNYYKFLRDVERATEGVFQDNYYIHYSKEIDRVFITVKFPFLIIKNTREDSHVIRDLYMRFALKNMKKGNTLDSLYKVKGTRGVLSVNEFITGYAHSHLTTSATSRFDNFCLGSSSLSNNLYSLSTDEWDSNPEKWKLMYEAFLYELTSFASWESLEGRPHIKMKTIGEKRYHSKINISETSHLLSALKLEQFRFKVLEEIKGKNMLNYFDIKSDNFSNITLKSTELLDEIMLKHSAFPQELLPTGDYQDITDIEGEEKQSENGGFKEDFPVYDYEFIPLEFENEETIAKGERTRGFIFRDEIITPYVAVGVKTEQRNLTASKAEKEYLLKSIFKEITDAQRTKTEECRREIYKQRNPSDSLTETRGANDIEQTVLKDFVHVTE